MSHSTTTGSLREAYLTTFLKELLPQGVSATSGVLCDASGQTSRQLDLVLTLDSSLPVISMRDGIALIPVESALLVIEIKSTLDASALDQLEKQNASLAKLGLSNKVPDGERFIIPSIVVALEESKLSCDKVSGWMKLTGNTPVCCVVGKYFVEHADSGLNCVVSKGEGAFNETLAFVSSFYNGVQQMKNMRKFEPNWAQYLRS